VILKVRKIGMKKVRKVDNSPGFQIKPRNRQVIIKRIVCGFWGNSPDQAGQQCQRCQQKQNAAFPIRKWPCADGSERATNERDPMPALNSRLNAR